jgi:hypothetical protein
MSRWPPRFSHSFAQLSTAGCRSGRRSASNSTACPHLLSVGDLHVENFGTWRDSDGRLVWGVNDFDEAFLYPYTMDLVRLTTSALLAARAEHLTMKPRDAATTILAAYETVMDEGGRPFVLGESHGWLRAIAESKLRDPVVFWKKMDANPTAKGEIPDSAREAIEHLLPEPGLPYRLARRRAGLGSLGRTRLVGIAEWKGARVAREAKALLPSALQCLQPNRVPSEILYGCDLAAGGAVSRSLRADARTLDRPPALALLLAH